LPLPTHVFPFRPLHRNPVKSCQSCQTIPGAVPTEVRCLAPATEACPTSVLSAPDPIAYLYRTMTPKLLIFDLDGTLIDSRADLATAVNLMRARYDLPPLPLDTVTAFIGNGVRMLVTRALGGTNVPVEDGMQIIAPLYRQHMLDATVLYPGTLDGLHRLQKAGHTLAVATNKPVDACETILAHFGIRPLFREVLGGGSIPNLKPHPEMIEYIMAATGLRPEVTWVIGDNYTDLECARRAGASSVFCAFGFGDRRQEEPTVTVQMFRDLECLFVD
jgi:phosphoglycolate phosphatase